MPRPRRGGRSGSVVRDESVVPDGHRLVTSDEPGVARSATCGWSTHGVNNTIGTIEPAAADAPTEEAEPHEAAADD
ncbi:MULTISPECIES: hypothetical protein [Halorubrum]|uniref:Uncharacterized protein n=1 Tax=Halorubrum hochstenium ATCC 700873 TaxID=1227481 RepID=M0F603_9EURY|nr:MULTISPECIES: hypothetical protein [Halorubrum]ELZ55456.1 hypothetical protein C467_09404 [Halorubrum hochstenium ATCC 700873]